MKTLLIIASLFICSCASTDKSINTQTLEVGMTTSQVQSLFGPPDQRDIKYPFEGWAYFRKKNMSGYSECTKIYFLNKRLVEMEISSTYSDTTWFAYPWNMLPRTRSNEPDSIIEIRQR